MVAICRLFVLLVCVLSILLLHGFKKSGADAPGEKTSEAAAARGEKGASGAGQGDGGSFSDPSAVRQRHDRHGVSCKDCHGTATEKKRPPSGKCRECHGSYEQVGELTKAAFPNPHRSHLGEVRCTQCHAEHRDSVFFCNKCHVFELVMP